MAADLSLHSVVIDTSRSPHARLRPVPLNAVTLNDSFWAPRRRINREVTLPSQYRQCEETGRIDNFRRAAGKVEGSFQGLYFNDSDVYKWLEAAAWTLAGEDDPDLARTVEGLVDEIRAAQQPDGYLNTYFMFDRAGQRWSNLRDMHELYCAGHLLQAAVAHHRATGSDALLDVARRLAEHIGSVFGPGEGQRLGTCGHPEIEMALVELARETGERRYRELAQFFIDVRGRKPGLLGGGAYHQDHRPFRELDRMIGHAVRAVYLSCGAADLYAETGEGALREALERLWGAMTERQMYLTGGIGARYEGEAFGKEYELPSERAYAETCAAIGSVLWSARMLALEGEARYADVLETALYNGVLAGISLDGQSYFYQNPLADDGTHRRQPWFGCACCPTNVVRLLAWLPSLFYSTSAEGIWVHLYAAGEARLALADGRTVILRQQTRYPWEGEIEIEVGTDATFSLMLRIPAWCETGATLEVNGRPWEIPEGRRQKAEGSGDGAACLVSQSDPSRLPSAFCLLPSDRSGSYVAVRRNWQRGDTARLRLPMPVRRIACHPYVAENAGRVALARGPLIYCLEQADLAGWHPRDLVLPDSSALTAEFRPELLGGVTVLRGHAAAAPPDNAWAGQLYRTAPLDRFAESQAQRREHAVEVTAIPYYAWANREPGAMQVWLRTR